MNDIQEKILRPMSGFVGILWVAAMLLGGVACFVLAALLFNFSDLLGTLAILMGFALVIGFFIALAGFKVVRPNEARVLTLFGKYHGTIRESGFYYVNPFCVSYSPLYNAAHAAVAQRAKELSAEGKAAVIPVNVSKAISTKTQTLDNSRQKVNDVLGNPIVIGAVVIWRVSDPTRAAFAVENYQEFLSIQTDSVIRNTARLYAYDIFDDDENDDGIKEKTLRGSSQEIADSMRTELQQRVDDAGLEILEVRITHLAYAEEIAAAMLQRQQASAIIAARQKIVDGAVGMVKMAIDKLGEDQVVLLDEERKAAMVSNLLVVLCGSKDAQPIVNSGSIY